MTFFEKHKEHLQQGIEAIRQRYFFAAYPEIPKAYAEDAISKGQAAFQSMMGKPFQMPGDMGETKWIGEEISPYTLESLGVTYGALAPEELTSRSTKAFQSWRKVSLWERTGVLMESLESIRERFFDMAFATQHTTGQSWIMSFQASGPHAADRAFETVAMAFEELTRFPRQVTWEKPMGKTAVKIEKTFQPMPLGIGLVICCSTFPVWNSLPGIYANLTAGNTTIVKPHPRAVLPIAICVAAIRKTMMEAGFDPDVIQLAVDTAADPVTKTLAEHPSIKLIDYTGNTEFGNWIERLQGKVSFTEKAGVNSVILDSVLELEPVMQNLAFSISLYSGQMCTAPQNVFIPEEVKGKDRSWSYSEVVQHLKEAIQSIADNPKMGAGVLGAIQNEKTLERAQMATETATPVLTSAPVANAEFAASRTVSPVLLEAPAGDSSVYEKELFGPIAVVIRTGNTEESLQKARALAEKHGAITCLAYSTDEAVRNHIGEVMNEAYTPVTFNLTGPFWVNQHAAFSDFHVTGGNPAGNASLTDPAFVIKRFVWVGNREMI